MGTNIKSVIITGASKGIGKAIAMAFASKGHQLFLCARHEEVLKNTVDEIRKAYPASTVHYKAVDLSNRQEAIDFGKWCLSFVEPDILINNAGYYVPGELWNEPEGQLEAQLAVNLLSAYHLTRTVISDMIQRGGGHIFNICSIASLDAYAQGGSYSISKFALLGFSKNLRLELKDKGIKVTAVCPGATYTHSWDGSGVEPSRIMEADDIAKMIFAAAHLSPQAVVEDIVMRPLKGDL
jgi:short-subunit dehydrogenase